MKIGGHHAGARKHQTHLFTKTKKTYNPCVKSMILLYLKPSKLRFYLIYMCFINKIENLYIALLSSENALQTVSSMRNRHAAKKY